MEFEEEYALKKQEIDEIIETFLPEEKGYASRISEAMNYSVRVGGKRLRPMLMLEAYRLFDKHLSFDVKALACAIEMIHTYSLVHDDLPAMDNDELRRGQPTTHKKFGEAVAILAGDGLLNYSMQVALQAFRRPANPFIVARAMVDLYNKAGIDGMIGGQVTDVLAEKRGEKIEKDKLDFIYENKTAALIEASLMIGCRLAPQSREKDVAVMEQVGSRIGLAFQIQDDILDVTGDEEKLGKPVGSDARNEKATYVTYTTIEEAREDVRKLTDEAIAMISPYCKSNDFIIRLFEALVGRSS